MAAKPVTIICLLDESASMRQNRSHVISALNAFIAEQKKITGECSFNLIKFGSKVRPLWKNVPIESVPELTNAEYSPVDGTALYDAIGYVFETYENKKDVIMVIFTDGVDNESKEYKQEDIAAKISNYKTDPHNWQFIYLGTDVSVSTQGSSLGVRNDNRTANMSCDFLQLPVLLPSISRGISYFRQGTAESATSSITNRTVSTSSSDSDDLPDLEYSATPTLQRTITSFSLRYDTISFNPSSSDK